MPLTKLQSHVLRVLAAERSPDSYIAGDTNADAKALVAGGLKLSWKKIVSGKREAELEGLGDRTRLDWVHDGAYDFFR